MQSLTPRSQKRAWVQTQRRYTNITHPWPIARYPGLAHTCRPTTSQKMHRQAYTVSHPHRALSLVCPPRSPKHDGLTHIGSHILTALSHRIHTVLLHSQAHAVAQNRTCRAHTYTRHSRTFTPTLPGFSLSQTRPGLSESVSPGPLTLGDLSHTGTSSPKHSAVSSTLPAATAPQP